MVVFILVDKGEGRYVKRHEKLCGIVICPIEQFIELYNQDYKLVASYRKEEWLACVRETEIAEALDGILSSFNTENLKSSNSITLLAWIQITQGWDEDIAHIMQWAIRDHARQLLGNLIT